MLLSDDGQLLIAAGSDNLVKVWETETGSQLQTLRAHPGIPIAMDFADESMALATISAEGALRVRPILSADSNNRLLHQGIVVDVAVSPDGHSLATTDPNHHVVELWKMPGQSRISRLDGKQKVAFSPDGKWLAMVSFASEKPLEGQLTLWDRSTMPYQTETGWDVGTLAYDSHLNFSDNSKLLAFRGKDDTVTLWDVEKRKAIHALPQHTQNCPTSFGTGDKTIATASDGQIRIWDVASGRLIALISNQNHGTRAICFSPDGNLLVAASGVTELRWWDVCNPMRPCELPPLRGHTDIIYGVAFFS
jgi:WD40 repeat protein